MDTVNIHEAKTQLSKLLTRVALGEEFIIANRGVPVAKLSPYRSIPVSKSRIPGRLSGQIKISEDFDASDEEITNLFEGDDN